MVDSGNYQLERKLKMAAPTDSTGSQWIIPVVMLLLGYATKSFSDWIDARRSSERERIAREENRRDRSYERRVTFQQQNLLEVQDTMWQLVVIAATIWNAQRHTNPAEGGWKPLEDSNDLAEKLRLGVTRMAMLSGRVRNDETRKLAETFVDRVGDMKNVQTLKEAAAVLKALKDIFEKVGGKVEEQIRMMEETEDSPI